MELRSSPRGNCACSPPSEAPRWRRNFLLGLLATLGLLTAASVEAAPANPNASAKAQQVLAYLVGLPKGTSNRVLSGQNLGHGAKAVTGYDALIVKLESQTKSWVALAGADYGLTVDAAGISAANQVLKKHWAAGGLVTVSIHFPNPFTSGDAWDRSGVDLDQLVTPGTSANTKWMGFLDKVAAGLAELRDAGVVVLWRPFHEMNGDWFWWSAKGGSWASQAEFSKLWKHMFDYFTATKTLNNLLWVYAPNVQTNTSAVKATTYYYPGSAMVDVVGLDAYLDSYSPIDSNQSYSALVALGKPFGLTEFGPKSVLDGSFDDNVIIQGIKAKTPQAVFWLAWHSWSGASVAIVDNQNAASLMADPWVISRDEVALGVGPAPADAAVPAKDAGVAKPDALGALGHDAATPVETGTGAPAGDGLAASADRGQVSGLDAGPTGALPIAPSADGRLRPPRPADEGVLACAVSATPDAEAFAWLACLALVAGWIKRSRGRRIPRRDGTRPDGRARPGGSLPRARPG